MTKKKSGRVALAQSTARRSATLLKAMQGQNLLTSDIVGPGGGVGRLAAFIEYLAELCVDELVDVTTDNAAVATAEMKVITRRVSESGVQQFTEWSELTSKEAEPPRDKADRGKPLSHGPSD